MREIEMTDIRTVLRFMSEYPRYKNGEVEPKQYVYGDQTEFA